MNWSFVIRRQNHVDLNRWVVRLSIPISKQTWGHDQGNRQKQIE